MKNGNNINSGSNSRNGWKDAPVWAKHLGQTMDRLAVTVDKSIKEAREDRKEAKEDRKEAKEDRKEEREERRRANIDRRRFDLKFEEFARDAARDRKEASQDRKAMVAALVTMNAKLTKIERNTSLWRNGGNGHGRNGGKRKKK